MSLPSIAVVILNWNGSSDLLACLSSLEKESWQNKEVIVVDNGSSDESCELVQKQFPSTTLLALKENLGYAGGNNVGISYALEKGHDFILILNNDTLVSAHFLTQFVSFSRENPAVGIIGGWPCLMSNPSKLDHLGGKWNPQTALFDFIGKEEPSHSTIEEEVDYVCGCSIFIKRAVFEKIGLLEPAFFLFWEEADFCMRAKKSGFKIAFCKKAVLLHKVSSSFTGGKPHTHYFWWRKDRKSVV